ncbi:beta-glucosidase-like [Olea europaea subsp. europaea]|uniref:Beta-glucosidase-like n=1 Tax=Olea europaea subsp. europaea TaxID=158383 RepID=A0A8S0TXR7_OLEEU|nr:beta-glucosidase-like [Olea europaea subsp. europaea]
MDVQSNLLLITSADESPVNGQLGSYTQTKIKRSDFPDHFAFGAATSAYQIYWTTMVTSLEQTDIPSRKINDASMEVPIYPCAKFLPVVEANNLQNVTLRMIHQLPPLQGNPLPYLLREEHGNRGIKLVNQLHDILPNILEAPQITFTCHHPVKHNEGIRFYHYPIQTQLFT